MFIISASSVDVELLISAAAHSSAPERVCRGMCIPHLPSMMSTGDTWQVMTLVFIKALDGYPTF